MNVAIKLKSKGRRKDLLTTKQRRIDRGEVPGATDSVLRKRTGCGQIDQSFHRGENFFVKNTQNGGGKKLVTESNLTAGLVEFG